MARLNEIVDVSTNPPTRSIVPFTTEEEAAADAAAQPTGDQIDAERDRRIGLPLVITLSGPRSFSINMDDSGLRNMNGLATAAVLAKVLGSSATTNFIAYDNTEVTLSPDDLIAMGLQVQARISAMTFAGRALKNMTPIPADFAADSYWA